MRVYLGADHAGFELKNQIKDHLTANGHEAVDCGAHVYDAVDHGFWLWVDQDFETRSGPALDAWTRLKAYLARTLSEG